MNIEEMFDFLVKEYHLSYKYQEFVNCYGGHWTVLTHSFYNASGCFTIYIEVQRGLEFWYASRFSTKREDLCQRGIDVTSIEPQIWDKHQKIGVLKNPFFWCSDKKVLTTLEEVLRVHLSKNNHFFGLCIEK